MCFLLGLLILTLSAPAPPAGSGTVATCDGYASTAGVDSAPGTKLRPFRTARRLVHSLDQGETGCFRAGTYRFSVLSVNQRNITLRRYQNETATLTGDIKIPPSGAHSKIKGMVLNAAGGAHETGPRIYADGVLLRNNVITNDHSGICIQISRYFSRPAPRGIVIRGNRIHDCGRQPSTNRDHGIYISHARGTVIRGNWIYDNVDRGVQQYPDAQGTLVIRNVIDGNGEGVNFGGRSGGCSNNNTVKSNVIANSRLGWNVYSGSQGLACRGNLLSRNCVYASNTDAYYNSNGGIETPPKSFSATANQVASPQYLDRQSGDFRLRPDSPCAELLGARVARIFRARVSP